MNLPVIDDVKQRLEDLGFAFGVANQVGFFSVDGARLLPAFMQAVAKYGPSPAIGFEASAMAFGDAVGLYDDLGALTFNELRDASDALAVALSERNIEAGTKVGVLARNHRGLVLSTVALSKLGADAVFLNTGFAGPQAVDVCAREGVAALLADQEFDGILEGVDAPRYLTFVDDPSTVGAAETIDDLVDEGLGRHPGKPARASNAIILTSGTT